MSISHPAFCFHATHTHAEARLFCFPYAGGGASVYRAWAPALGPDIDVFPVQLPGRETRLGEQPARSLQQMVGPLVDAMLPQLSERPALFGHSMGALVAFEVARELRRRGAPSPAALFVSGAPAPHLARWRDGLHAQDDRALLDALRRLGGTPDEILADPEFVAMLLPIMRADLRVVETYGFTLDAALDCPIIAFGGAGDDQATPHEVRAWRAHTRARFSTVVLPGGHFFVHEHEHSVLAAVAGALVEGPPSTRLSDNRVTGALARARRAPGR